MNVVSELEDEFYHFHYVYTEVEYLDINDDFEIRRLHQSFNSKEFVVEVESGIKERISQIRFI